MNIKHERALFTLSNRRLRRARRLYLFRLRHFIVTPEWLWWVSDRMRASGLYNEKKSDKDTAWGILRYLYSFEREGYHMRWSGWHEWMADKGWQFMFRDWRDGRPRSAA